ncbi:hypothetical protein [Lentilitoribacter sp. EG35]|uniref:hypothetical protein n=1 Tax=Lentilitoribacter sp. EG35 TaxID=3234192 RepID=UPI003460E86F
MFQKVGCRATQFTPQLLSFDQLLNLDIAQLTEKLAHIDRLRDQLDTRRDAILDRLAKLKAELSN